jgi:hypothetical protein
MGPEYNWDFVAAAYGASWVMFIGYWVYLHRLLKHARRSAEQAIAAVQKSQRGEA